jgi:hypothetical protein
LAPTRRRHKKENTQSHSPRHRDGENSEDESFQQSQKVQKLCTVLFGGFQTGTRREDNEDGGELLVDEKSESSVQVD